MNSKPSWCYEAVGKVTVTAKFEEVGLIQVTTPV